jgi:hypothetical protein
MLNSKKLFSAINIIAPLFLMVPLLFAVQMKLLLVAVAILIALVTSYYSAFHLLKATHSPLSIFQKFIVVYSVIVIVLIVLYLSVTLS